MAEPRRIGDYEVVRTLGQGGMGVVLEVRDPRTGRGLAVKLIRDASPKLEARFEREAEVLGKIQHRNVVRIHDFGRKREGLVIVQELIEGEGLDARCRQGPLDPNEAARIARDLADALAAVHRRAILHRDLKPANVILRPDGIPVLLDFGMAQDATAMALTKTGAFVGTPAYMSPEQADGNARVDNRSDVYGLGAILLEMLSGEKPFEGTTINILHSILRGDGPPSARARRREVPAELDAIARKAMAKDRDERYQDMESFREDLDRVLAGRPPLALAELTQRRSVLPWLGGGVVLAGLLIGGLFAHRTATAEPATAEEPPKRRRARPVAPVPQKPLFQLGVGDRFDYRYEFKEFNGEIALVIGGVHRAQVSQVEGDKLTLLCTAASVRLVFGSPSGNVSFDSADLDLVLDEGHPLKGATAMLGKQFTVVVDRGSGAIVTCEGMDSLRDPMIAALKTIDLGLPLNMEIPTRSLLSNENIGHALDSLWHVRPQPETKTAFEPLPWEQRKGPYRLLDVSARMIRVPTVWRPKQIRRAIKEGVDLEGKAEFAGGRPVRSRIRQTLAPSEPALTCEWSYELLPPPVYDGYRVGDRFRYAYRFHEAKGQATQNDIRGVHEVEITGSEGDLLTLTCTARSLRIGYGDGPTARYYDTEEKNDGPAQLVKGSEETLGKSFRLLLDRRSGQLRCRGMENLKKPMYEALRASPFPGVNFHAVPAHWLTDDQIGTTLDTVFAAAGKGALPWTETTGGNHLLLLTNAEAAVKPLTRGQGKVQIEGTLRRAEGRLREAKVVQTHADGTTLTWSYRELEEN